jgi:hypothetical protein
MEDITYIMDINLGDLDTKIENKEYYDLLLKQIGEGKFNQIYEKFKRQCKSKDKFNSLVWFLTIKYKEKEEVSPTIEIDQIWHQLLLNPLLYIELCYLITDSKEIIDHNPERANDPIEEINKRRKIFENIYYTYFLRGFDVIYEKKNYTFFTNNLKKSISDHFGIPDHNIDLIFKVDRWYLTKINYFTINVRMIHKEEINNLYVNDMSIVYDIKNEMRTKTGIPCDQQRLIFNGKQLSDNSFLVDLEIKSGSVIDLILALREC